MWSLDIQLQVHPTEPFNCLFCLRVIQKARLKTVSKSSFLKDKKDKIKRKLASQIRHHSNFHLKSLFIVSYRCLPPRIIIALGFIFSFWAQPLAVPLFCWGGCTTVCGFTQTLSDILVPFIKRRGIEMVKETGRKKALAGIHSGPTGATKAVYFQREKIKGYLWMRLMTSLTWSLRW